MTMTPTEQTRRLRDVAEQFRTTVINAHDPEANDQIFHPDAHFAALPEGYPPGVKGLKQWHGTLFRAFPDLKMEIQDTVCEGDKLAVRWSMRGTHRGEIFGAQPTNREVTIRGISMLGFRDGKVAEVQATIDRLGMLEQMGVVKAPA